MPAGLTLDQFIQVMRTGKDFDNLHPQMGPLLQVMPWPISRNMTDDDLRAKTAAWKTELAAIPELPDQWAKLDEILPEAFAVVKNAARRLTDELRQVVEAVGSRIVSEPDDADVALCLT